MNKLQFMAAAGAVLGLMLLAVPSASADTVTGAGTAAGTAYRGGVPSLGSVSWVSSVQISRDPAGDITAVRGAGRVTEKSKVARVQVDWVALSSTTAAVAVNSVAANSGTGTTVISFTKWVSVAPGSCANYRVRSNYSVRWSDGGLSTFNELSPLTKVCGPTSPPKYANCASMNNVFAHGVGRPGAVDHTSGTPVTSFYVSSYIYNANGSALDRDKDGVACEKL